jgi:hypothetical protein
VLRVFGDGGETCSLGRHCEAIALSTAGDAYRRAHHRFSDPAAIAQPEVRPTGGAPVRGTVAAWVEEPTLLDVITDAMEQLDRINPANE